MTSSTRIHPENQAKGICVICSAKVDVPASICHKCRRPCELTRPEIVDEQQQIAKVVSMCCGADVDLFAKTTCSDKCHEEFISFMEDNFGRYKKVTDEETSIAYRVPTRDIIESGLNQGDLPKYPRWTEEKDDK